ncbi:MAG: DUF3500 domain-containing protein [Lentisphaeraceae bacterium]|nr:DUF3500 domain-containing protein [Lentisphaeraceae bacterium]
MENNSINRRRFLQTTGALALTAASGNTMAAETSSPSENLIKEFYKSLSSKQKAAMCFPWEHIKRDYISNNWNVVDEDKYSIGSFYTSQQQNMLHGAVKGMLSAEGFARYEKQMKDDSGGFGTFTCAVFGDPSKEQFNWVLTGRHATLRIDGNSIANAAFGGPIFYGHAVRFTEKPNHPGNVWWYQAKLANNLFNSLTGEQQKAALLEREPRDTSEVVQLKGLKGKFAGIAGKSMNSSQKKAFQNTLDSLLNNYRSADAMEARKYIEAGGGLDNLHISFYSRKDLGDDKVWDNWLIEGPGLVWYFRGAPHVHSWVNIGKPV